jgi:methylated-DNA-[protein]-cysteine S-methyltransferase
MARFLINVPSPVGPWGIEGEDGLITAILLPHQHRDPSIGVTPRFLSLAVTQLMEYFEGQRHVFDVPLAPVAATPFQHAVWAALAAIPYGEVRTYRDVADAVGRPRAFRAVGNANHVNPCPAIVPCHRVVAQDGLGGYGGGDEAKRYLLAIEGVHY